MTSPPARRVLQDRNEALAYLRFYREVIAAHFPAIGDRMPPETDGQIGFIAEFLLAQRSLGMLNDIRGSVSKMWE